MEGIIQLRGLIQTMHTQQTTVVIVSHDVNLINSVATDVIHFADQNLTYYRGNYIDFLIAKQQHDLHRSRQQQNLDKQRDSMIQTIDNLKKKGSAASSSGSGSKKLSKAVSSRKKKLERHGIEKDEYGHRLTVQAAGTGIKAGSINMLDASTRKKLSYKQLTKRSDISVAAVPDKAVQFCFHDTNCAWGEALISALDVGHGFVDMLRDGRADDGDDVDDADAGKSELFFLRKKGMLFDSVDLSINENSTVCILGANSSGKSTLLKILAKAIVPLEGEVHYAHNANICYFDQHKADELVTDGMNKYGQDACAVTLLCQMFSKKSEQDIRGTLADFGLGAQQALTHVQFLSGGERCRLCLTMLMLQDPHVLIMDEPSNHLDPESVEALAYGLKAWNGTVVMVSHDVHLIRLLEGTCHVLSEAEGKLRRLEGGIDSFLNILGAKAIG
jgi:ATPase subunit of ABC transporter with duplicated ATPase domains